MVVIVSAGTGAISGKGMRDTIGLGKGVVVLLFLFRHGAWSSPEGHPRIALGYFILKALLLYPTHAIAMRLHGRDSYVVILVPETADLLGL